MDQPLLTAGVLVCVVALYAAFATRAQLVHDWPARKVRVRDGSQSSHGPFRAIENTSERDVAAGPPWPVHLTALLGHGISPLSFFVTIGAWIYSWVAFTGESDPSSNLPGSLVLVAVIVSFVLGRHQWRGSTVALRTDFSAARAHTGRAVVGRLVVDGVPLALMVAASGADRDYLALALGYSIPTLHALLALLAVLVSKRHYEAAAVALEERRTDTFGEIPR